MIVWDLGGVLTRFHPDRRLAALVAATGLADAAVERAIWGSGLDADAEVGHLSDGETWVRVQGALGDRIDRDELRRCWALAFEPDPPMLALVDDIGGGALLSNNGPLVTACLRHELAEVGRRVDPWLLSWHLGATKPGPEVFDRAADLLGRRPDDLVLVDDGATNVEAARRAGWRAVHHEDVATTREALDREA